MPSGGERIVIPERWLMVVARDRPRLYANLRESFEGNPLVAVIVDRRQAGPGGAAATPADEAQIRRRQPLSPEQTGTWLLRSDAPAVLTVDKLTVDQHRLVAECTARGEGETTIRLLDDRG